jgi:hypothetical protein
MDAVPYESKPQAGLLVEAGGPGCFAIPFPSRGLLTKMIIEQTGDDPRLNFTAALFNSENACVADQSESDSEGSYTGTVPPNVFRVTPDMNSDSPGYLEFFANDSPGGHGYTVFNQDARSNNGGPGDRNIGPPKELWLRITTSGNSQATFAVVLGGYNYQ